MKNIKSYLIGIFHLTIFILGGTIRLDMLKYPNLFMLIPKAVFLYVLFKAL